MYAVASCMMSLTKFGLVALGAEETDMGPPGVVESIKGGRIIVQAPHGCQTTASSLSEMA